MRFILAAAAALALAGCSMSGKDDGAADTSVSPPTAGVTDAMIAAADGGEWLTYGRDYGEQRFSPLTQVDAASVGKLGLAWFADLDTARGQEATPLMHDGVLYVTTAWSKVYAYDAATGQLKWSYDPKVPRETLVRACCDAVNRGVALYGDKVYVGTLDGRLVALNQKDGTVAWSKLAVPDQDSYTITGAPRVAKGLVLIGSGGSEYKARGYRLGLRLGDRQGSLALQHRARQPGRRVRKEGPNAKAMEAAAKTWGGEMVEARRRRHRVGFDRLRSRHQPRAVRHRQCRAVEPCGERPRRRRRALHRLDRRGGRRYRRLSLALPGNPGGPLGLRQRRADHARRPRDRRRDSATSRCTRPRTASSTCSTRRPASSFRPSRSRSRTGPPGSIPRPARRRSARSRALREGRQAVRRPARRDRRAQLAPDELQRGDRAGLHSDQPGRPGIPGRQGLEGERHRLPDRARQLEDDDARRQGHARRGRQDRYRRAGRVGSGRSRRRHGACPIPGRGTAARWRPRAAWCSRAPRRATSSPTTPGTGANCGASPHSPASSPRR